MKSTWDMKGRPYESSLYTMDRATNLQQGDLVDFRDSSGKFILARVMVKNGNQIIVRYPGGGQTFDVRCDLFQDLLRFAKPREISQRPPQRLRELREGDVLAVNPPPHPGWKRGRIQRFDHEFRESGQVQVEYQSQGQAFRYWVHLDNNNEVNGRYNLSQFSNIKEVDAMTTQISNLLDDDMEDDDHKEFDTNSAISTGTVQIHHGMSSAESSAESEQSHISQSEQVEKYKKQIQKLEKEVRDRDVALNVARQEIADYKRQIQISEYKKEIEIAEYKREIEECKFDADTAYAALESANAELEEVTDKNVELQDKVDLLTTKLQRICSISFESLRVVSDHQ